MCSLSGLALTLVLPVCCQVGYAFKDEVALVEVAHKHNVDLPAVRVRPSCHHSACGLSNTLKPVAASVSSTCLWCKCLENPAVHLERLCWCSSLLCHNANVACCVLQLFVKAGAGSNGVGRPSGGVILDKVLPHVMWPC